MKIVKMAAIATMALTLFASCNKKDEPKKEISSICIRLNETALRAFEDQIPDGAVSKVTDNVKVIINDGKQVLTLTPADITEATNTGCKKPITVIPTKVAVIANSDTNGKNINTFQGLGGFTDTDWKENPLNKKGTFDTKIPLYGETTTITRGKDGDVITYTAVVEVKPALARLEIAGKIEAKEKNSKGENAIGSITVEEVYINNYRTIGGQKDRTYIKANPDLNGFESDPDALMMDKIKGDYQIDFSNKKYVAGYQLFPETPEELAANPFPKDFYTHVVLKVSATIPQQKGRVNRDLYYINGYITIRSFMENATGDLKGFQAGTIYKLDLADLSQYFTTDEDLNPQTPITPEPEPDKKALIVKVKALPWTAKNIKPDIIAK